MEFIDEARVFVAAGNGGNGAVSWRREKYVPLGGPDGGDGGSGGAVIFRTDPGHNTLLDFSYNPLIRAEHGLPGGPKQLTGRDGTDAIRVVPVGTQVFHEEQLVADLSVAGAEWIAARGGRGGKGNMFFKSSTNQAPDYAQPGQAGQNFELRLVLKSVADVGLVGFPNAGKSTFISAISKATPKIADYEFTTLKPHLGVAELSGERRFVVADIPGLIPGAHEGKGLGLRFLRHIERTAVLLQFIDITRIDKAEDANGHAPSDESVTREVVEQFEAIDRELQLFSDAVAKKPRVVVLSKGDLDVAQRAHELAAAALNERLEQRPFLISSATGAGVEQALEAVYRAVSQVRSESGDIS